VYNAGYVRWCISRKVSIGGVCLQIDDVDGNMQAHQFLRSCGAELQHCRLIGDQMNDAVSFDIPYEALIASNNLREFVVLRADVSMATLRRALCKRLTMLRFFHCKFQEGEPLNIAVKCSNLTTLCFANSVDIAETLLISIIKHCANLRVLSIWNVLTISDKAFMAVALHLPQLESLYAQNCPVSDVGVCAVAQSCRHLQEIFIGALDPLCPITDDSILDIVRHCPELQVLWLDRVPGITSQVLHEIVARRPNLRMLGVLNMMEVTNPLVLEVVDCCPALTDLSLPCSFMAPWDTLAHIAVTCINLEVIQYCGASHVYPCGTGSLFKDTTAVLHILSCGAAHA
jgi:hypothetical protein